MHPADDIDYLAVRRAAARYLSRWSDRTTESLREDLAQEATIVTWRRRQLLRDLGCAEAFARTVARRLRARALRRRANQRVAGLESCTEHELWDPDLGSERRGGWFQVAETEVCDDRLLAWLDRSMGRLTRSNAEILRGFYAGDSCRELADRLGLDTRAVKSRLHRGRRRLRELLEWRAAGASSSPAGSAAPAGLADPSEETKRAER